MKKTFKKLTAISLAALTLAFGSCVTSFASESQGEKENGYYYGDIAEDYKNRPWDYDFDSDNYFATWTSYDDSVFLAEEYLAFG